MSIDRVEVSVTNSHWSLLNSAGVDLSGAQTACDFSIMGMAKENGEVTSFDYDGGVTSTKSEIESEIESSIGRFRESVVNSLNPKKGTSYKGPVLFHPYAVVDLMGAVIGANCNGQAHAEGLSPWKTKVGEMVASEMLDAFEDPTDRTRVSGWTMFDREGCMTARHEILKQGKLNFVAHNLFSASRSGAQTTGNAVGGSGTMPKVGLSNFGIRASSKAIQHSDTGLMKELRQGLVLKRFSGNMDPYSGHFSGVAKNSWWIDNGNYSHPVSEVMVAGNLFDILKQVVAVGNNLHKLMGSGIAPYILVDGISVTSA
jgi:PmbA protein